MDALAKLDGATRALAEARTLGEVAQIRDIAEAARTYARAAKLGLEAQNHATEIKLRAERKAGELLGELERGKPNPSGANQYTEVPRHAVGEPSPYRQAIESAEVEDRQAQRWQKVATIPEPIFEDYIAETKNAREELSTAGMLRAADPHVTHNTGNNEWYTPEEYIDAARMVLGEIDLDPASTEVANTNVKASEFYSTNDDGLTKSWAGKVWMNPPYARHLIGRFAEKLCVHYESGEVTEAIALVNNATETIWFQRMARSASAVCFPKGRIEFWQPLDRKTSDKDETGGPLQGQALIYLGSNPTAFVDAFGSMGFVATINE